ncbi:hypothetical protein D0T23_29610 [Duganella sp. BJB475]|nr:hypothetical protein D0T23_29610 [Duganella sp. BJB475]RFP22582.1 hypothetical protein D0T21_30575 [Duganella sp. BJB476]
MTSQRFHNTAEVPGLASAYTGGGVGVGVGVGVGSGGGTGVGIGALSPPQAVNSASTAEQEASVLVSFIAADYSRQSRCRYRGYRLLTN